MQSTDEIRERREFRLLPDEDIGFATPAIEWRDADGEVHVEVAAEHRAPEPELARSAGDPGWWKVMVWLPVGAEPLRLVPDPEGPNL